MNQHLEVMLKEFRVFCKEQPDCLSCVLYKLSKKVTDTVDVCDNLKALQEAKEGGLLNGK